MRFWLLTDMNCIIWAATREQHANKEAILISASTLLNIFFHFEDTYERDFPLTLEDLPTWALEILMQ